MSWVRMYWNYHIKVATSVCLWSCHLLTNSVELVSLLRGLIQTFCKTLFRQVIGQRGPSRCLYPNLTSNRVWTTSSRWVELINIIIKYKGIMQISLDSGLTILFLEVVINIYVYVSQTFEHFECIFQVLFKINTKIGG